MEEYPNITWENETKKPFEGDDFQKGSASSIYSFKSALDLRKEVLPPIHYKQIVLWLAKCLYACNMNNFKDKS